MKPTLLKKLSFALGVATMFVSANTASAVSVINLGGAPMTGSGPTIANNSIVLSFAQNGTGNVRLTISAGPDAIKVDYILFNVGQAVTFAFVSGVNPSGGFAYSSNAYGLNGSALDGFDVKVAYETSGSNGQFFSGQTTVVDIFGSALVEGSFNVLTDDGYLGGVHISKPLNGDASGKYVNTGRSTVPDGGWTLALFGLALGAVALISRRGAFLR